MTGAPDDKRRLDAGIARADALRAAGDAAGAAEALAALRAGPLAALPPVTALGINRRLHAALLRQAKAAGDPAARLGLQAHLGPAPGVLEPLAALTAAERAAFVAAAVQPIPRLLHQLWIGPLPPPPTLAAWAAHAADRGYAHLVWRESDLAAAGIDRDPAFAARAAAGDWPGAADAARYAILAAQGGVWLDADWFPAGAALHGLIPMAGLAVLAEPVPRLTGAGSLLLANSAIAAPPRHPAMERLVAILPAALAAIPRAPAWWVTGPVVFTLVVRQGPVTLIPSGAVAPALPAGATLSQARAAASAAGPGCWLVPWKPWVASAGPARAGDKGLD